MQTDTKTNNGLIHIMMQKESKRCKHIENAPLLSLKNKLSFLKTGTVHVHGAGKSSYYGKRMFVRTKPPYGQNHEHDAIKVRDIPSCVLISSKPQVKTREALSTGE